MSTIIFTQPLTSGSDLQKKLENEGCKVLRFPMVKTKQLALSPVLTQSLERVHTYDYFIFTSKNGVEAWFSLLNEAKVTPPKGKYISIGKKTTRALAVFKQKVHYENIGTTAVDLVQQIKKGALPKGAQVLAVLGNLAPNTLQKELEDYLQLQRVNVYETKPAIVDKSELRLLIANATFDRVIFTSPSGVRNMQSILQKHWWALQNKCVCIGSVTACALSEYGIEPLAVAAEASTEGLLEAILGSL